MPRDDDGSPDSIDAYDRIVFHWPYPYDLLVWALTFGRERAPRERLADLARLVPGESALDGGALREVSMWQRLLGRPVSESGSLCHMAGNRRRAPAAGRCSRWLFRFAG